ncbi:hypothetical protein [Arthrobacter bambusae]|uniref:hypothetical protein n=1 Tax=Arthrobacter bambusae TaxID=1338426 RepID=UPI0027895F89|nr:hypothetical protein [Arthrobacter bambusae]MDQ0032092.1 hypothetical protein [Arthrobacter bambusae]MDQ0100232.1 hypothetical protein [Arthrobacter bambusae]
MYALKKLATGAITAAVLAASVGLAAPAKAAEPQSAKDTVQTVKRITAKASGLLGGDAVFTKQGAMVGTAEVHGEVGPLVAAIAADDAQNAVVASTNDAQSMIMVLDQGKSSADFSMSIPDGYVAELTNDGGVQLRNQSAHIVIPFISAPWALDAIGKKLPTSYVVNGSKITQHVNTDGAHFPIVADPSIQWIPYPVVAMYGWEAETIGKMTASILLAGPGASCTLIGITGWVGKVFSAICSLVGLGSAKDIVRNIGSVWRSSSGLISWGCYGFQIWNPGAGAISMPARACA